MFDFDNAVSVALRTWYPKDHNLHFNPRHPLGKLCGGWRRLFDSYMKSTCKPDYQFEPLIELGNIWYYIRILCYQKNHKPVKVRIDNSQDSSVNSIITHVIGEASHASIDYHELGDYRISVLNTSWTVLLIICDKYDITLQELTKIRGGK